MGNVLSSLKRRPKAFLLSSTVETSCSDHFLGLWALAFALGTGQTFNLEQ